MFKVIGHMGDGLENLVLGLISSILPSNNAIATKISNTSKSNYFFQETIKSGHSMFPKHRIFEISACRKGCCAFIGPLINEDNCPICDKPNEPNQNEVIYYFPFQDRLRSLLMSDLKRFIEYPKIRVPPAPGYIEDIYDGENWKWFEDQMDPARYGLLVSFSVATNSVFKRGSFYRNSILLGRSRYVQLQHEINMAFVCVHFKFS